MGKSTATLNARITGIFGLLCSLSVCAGPLPGMPGEPPLPGARPPPLAQPGIPVIAPGAVQLSPIGLGKPLPSPPALWVFANPVASVVGPTTVELRWQGRPGATGYRVWRNGVAIADVPAQQSPQSFVDEKLAPGFDNTYKLWAMQVGRKPTEDPLGVFLEESAPAYASSPVAAPALASPHQAPTDITATIIAAGASTVVRLSWQPAQLADGYFVSRDGNLISGLVAGTTFDDGAPASGGHYYQIRSVYPTPDGAFDMSAGTLSNSVRVRFGALNVIAVGDSIMWGQGLADLPGMPHKFTSIVHDWLQNAMGRPVTLSSFAHSGAIYRPGSAADESTTWPGEVPSSFPSVSHQALIDAPAALGSQGISLSDVDMVLVDGCSNDIGITNFLDPRRPEQETGATTTQICSGMVNLLADIHAMFPYARIVVTGYFPIVSASSDLSDVASLALDAGIIVGTAAAAQWGIPLDPVTLLISGTVTADALRTTLIGHSNTYVQASTMALATAASALNAQWGPGWVSFVSPPFRSDNTYASPNSWLWKVPGGPNPKDEVYDQRRQWCGSVKLPADGDPATCVIASIGHPNVLGAQAYADAITALLPAFFAAWNQSFSTVQHAP